VEQAYNAVASCRYPRPKTADAYEPAGCAAINRFTRRATGGSRRRVLREGGRLALAPHGEILVIVMCEDVDAVDNLPRILKEVKGIGVVLIGEGDLSQNLGYPRQYDHPAVVEAMTAIRRICGEHGVVCGHPHVDARNAQRVIDEGYRFLMAAPARTFAGLDACRTITGRT